MIPSPLSELVDAAAAATDRAAFERPLFEALDRSIGFDIAFCIRVDGVGPHSPGLDPTVRARFAGILPKCRLEYAGLKAHALEQRGVGVDLDFFGRSALERTQTYRDVMLPHQGRSTLLMFFEDMTLVLGRTYSKVRPAEIETLANARSLIAVCEQAMDARLVARPNAPRLSPRELELVGYLRLGYTNNQIAVACGTSFRTVRNQLSRLFEKLEASTRAEAVARSFELRL
jgi:DNA-binding CsgD family transcriptional regulator